MMQSNTIWKSLKDDCTFCVQHDQTSNAYYLPSNKSLKKIKGVFYPDDTEQTQNIMSCKAFPNFPSIQEFPDPTVVKPEIVPALRPVSSTTSAYLL